MQHTVKDDWLNTKFNCHLQLIKKKTVTFKFGGGFVISKQIIWDFSYTIFSTIILGWWLPKGYTFESLNLNPNLPACPATLFAYWVPAWEPSQKPTSLKREKDSFGSKRYQLNRVLLRAAALAKCGSPLVIHARVFICPIRCFPANWPKVARIESQARFRVCFLMDTCNFLQTLDNRISSFQFSMTRNIRTANSVAAPKEIWRRCKKRAFYYWWILFCDFSQKKKTVLRFNKLWGSIGPTR
jgi:hypothetical protein